MAKYCVAYVNFVDNNLKQHIVESLNDVNACVDFIKEHAGMVCPLPKEEEEKLRSFSSIEDIQAYTFEQVEQDYLVSVIKI